MQTRKPGGVAARQLPCPPLHETRGSASHARAKVCQKGAACAFGVEGVHPPSEIASDPIVRDCTHSTPEQSLPEAMAVLVSHAPDQLAAGSNVVCVVAALFSAHVAAFAVMVVGRLQEPVGDVHEHI